MTPGKGEPTAPGTRPSSSNGLERAIPISVMPYLAANRRWVWYMGIKINGPFQNIISACCRVGTHLYDYLDHLDLPPILPFLKGVSCPASLEEWVLFYPSRRVCSVLSRTVCTTGCSLHIVFFPKKIVIFLNSVSSAASLVFYLPGVCTHTDTEDKQRKASVRNILKSSGKNTIFNEHPVW